MRVACSIVTIDALNACSSTLTLPFIPPDTILKPDQTAPKNIQSATNCQIHLAITRLLDPLQILQ